HVRTDGAPPARRLVKRSENRLGRQVAAERRRPRPRELADLLEPALARPRAYLRGEPARDVASVAHDPHRDGDVLPDLRAVQVDVDDASAGGEPGGVYGDAVVETQPDADDQVGVLDGAVHPHLAVHPRHAEAERG